MKIPFPGLEPHWLHLASLVLMTALIGPTIQQLQVAFMAKMLTSWRVLTSTTDKPFRRFILRILHVLSVHRKTPLPWTMCWDRTDLPCHVGNHQPRRNADGIGAPERHSFVRCWVHPQQPMMELEELLLNKNSQASKPRDPTGGECPCFGAGQRSRPTSTNPRTNMIDMRANWHSCRGSSLKTCLFWIFFGFFWKDFEDWDSCLAHLTRVNSSYMANADVFYEHVFCRHFPRPGQIHEMILPDRHRHRDLPDILLCGYTWRRIPKWPTLRRKKRTWANLNS